MFFGLSKSGVQLILTSRSLFPVLHPSENRRGITKHL
jgi:hypothetical protein